MKKNEKIDPFIKVGRIKKSVAEKAHIKSADIYISQDHISHIETKHKAELEAVGISAMNFVKFVLSNFNQIRLGSNESFLLVVYEEKKNMHNTAAITLNYISKKGFWEIRTAQPRKTKDIEKRKRIW